MTAVLATMTTPDVSLSSRPTSDGRSVAVMRAIDNGDSCVVEAEVFPAGNAHAVQPGPYTFADAREATAFVTEAVEALMYLGCDIQAA